MIHILLFSLLSRAAQDQLKNGLGTDPKTLLGLFWVLQIASHDYAVYCLLLFAVKTCVFLGSLCNRESFFGEFLYVNAMKACKS